MVHGCFVSAICWKAYAFSPFPAGGLYDWGILLIIFLEFQGKSINRFLWHSLLNCSKAIINNVTAIEPANGKFGEKGCIVAVEWSCLSTMLRKWNNHIPWRAFWKAPFPKPVRVPPFQACSPLSEDIGSDSCPQHPLMCFPAEGSPRSLRLVYLRPQCRAWKMHSPLPAHGAMPEWGFPMALPAGYGRDASTAPFFAFFGASFRCKKLRRNSLAIFL